MRASLLFTLTSMLLLAGCTVKSDDAGKKDAVDGTSKEVVAGALTKGVTIPGAMLISGDLPDTTEQALTLIGDDQTVVPGGTALLPFDADNPDQDSDPIKYALMQFSGSEDHFELLIDDPEVDGTKVSFTVKLKVDAGICEKLCNEVLVAKIETALKLKSGAIGKHDVLTLMLDCTKDGDPDLCEDKGDAAAADALPFRSLELQNDITYAYCNTCGATGPDCTPFSVEYLACVDAAVAKYAGGLREYVDCSDAYYDAQLKCATAAADCDAIKECDFYVHPSGSSPQLDCGTAPAGFQPELDKCTALLPDAGVAPAVDAGDAP